MAPRIPPRAPRTSWLVALGASLVASCGGDTPPRATGTAAAPLATVAATGPSTAAKGPPSTSAAPRRRHARGARAREGETSVEALFDRAREALAAGDDLGLVRCLEPGSRRRWLTDALLAIEVEAQDPRYQDDLARRRAVGA